MFFAINSTVFNKSTTIFHGLVEILTLSTKKGRFLDRHRRRREPLGMCASKMQLLAQSRGNPAHYRAQNFRRPMLGCQKGRSGRETTKKKTAKNRVKKYRLNKECIIFLRGG